MYAETSEPRNLKTQCYGLAAKIGIGGSLTTSPLPHHRTYGSVRATLLHQLHRVREGAAGQGRGPLLRGTRPREGSRQNSIGGLGRAFTPAFRAGSLSLNPWRVGAEENLARRRGLGPP